MTASVEESFTSSSQKELTFAVGEGVGSVSALLLRPDGARLLYVLAHGAGAGMRHTFLESIAQRLADCGIATLRYQFPYMERRAGRPDPPAVAAATVRAAVMEATRVAPGLPLVAGGKSFGGRMTSTAQAEAPLPGVRGPRSEEHTSEPQSRFDLVCRLLLETKQGTCAPANRSPRPTN